MTRIVCGWCGKATVDAAACSSCRRDPRAGWRHRDTEPPAVPDDAGRPTLDGSEVRTLYTRAVDELRDEGREPTVEAIAERLDRSPRTIRQWRQRFDL